MKFDASHLRDREWSKFVLASFNDGGAVYEQFNKALEWLTEHVTDEEYMAYITSNGAFASFHIASDEDAMLFSLACTPGNWLKGRKVWY